MDIESHVNATLTLDMARMVFHAREITSKKKSVHPGNLKEERRNSLSSINSLMASSTFCTTNAFLPAKLRRINPSFFREDSSLSPRQRRHFQGRFVVRVQETAALVIQPSPRQLGEVAEVEWVRPSHTRPQNTVAVCYTRARRTVARAHRFH